jgi:hypothetical protein
MSMPDINKIFGLFSDNEKENHSEEITTVAVNFLDTPAGKIGMFVKLIQNNIAFNKALEKFFEKEGHEYDKEMTQKASEFTVFNRAWHYIKTVNIEKRTHLHALTKYNPKVLANSLDRTISFFENLEAYEKCAHMHNILKIVKKI